MVLKSGFKMTEFGPLPEDWEVVRLGDYCRLFSGYAFRSSDFVDSGILVIKIGNLQDGTIIIDKKTSYFPPEKVTKQIEKYKLCKGDILIALTGATTGKIAVVPDKFEGSLLNQRVGKFEIFNEKLDKDFFRYLCLLNSFQKKIKENILQSAQGNISPKQIEQIYIPLPPLPEQKAIARVLKTIQDAIEATERVIAAAKELKKSLMRHLFTYGPVPVSERDRVRLKQTEIGPIPEDWKVVRLGEVCDVKGGKRLPKGHSFSEIPTKFPYIRVVDFMNWTVDTKNLKYLTEEDAKLLQRYRIFSKDVFISIAGTVGLVGMIPKELDGAYLTENAARIVIKDFKYLEPNFLVAFLVSARGQYEIDQRTTKTSQPKLALARIREIPIPLPPISVQQKIAQILKTVDDKISAEEKKKEALQAFFKTMLHRLMTGKIRVKYSGEDHGRQDFS